MIQPSSRKPGVQQGGSGSFLQAGPHCRRPDYRPGGLGRQSGFGGAEGIQKLVHLPRQHLVGFFQLVYLLYLPRLAVFEILL